MLRNTIYVLSALLIFIGAYAEAQVVEKDLAAYWAFDEGKGNITEDLSGHENIGNIKGQFEWVEGILGNAIECKGSTVVDCGKGESLEIPQDITTEFWINPTEKIDSKNARIDILYMHWGPMFAFCPTWAPDGTLYFWFDGPEPKPGVRSKIKEWEKGTWYYIVGTYDGSVVKLYVNTELQGTFNSKGDILERDQPLNIGRTFIGIVDEVKVYSRALTEQEIKRNYDRILRGGEAVDAAGKCSLTWGQIKNAME